MADAVTLLDNLSADGAGPTFRLPLKTHRPSAFEHFYTFVCYATNFGGGRVRVEVSLDGGSNWFTARTLNDNQLIWDVSDYMYAPIKAELIRGTLTGSVGASGVNLFAF